MKKIRVAGVPEHFNLPWHLCIEDGEFSEKNLEVKWTDVPEGTGKLCQMLRNNETDVAVILTEGIVKDILAGNDSKIVQVYVQSPLIWGIHVDANSRFENISELENTTVAISRKGSGSQLMAYVNAGNLGWNPENLKFEIVNTIDGAVESLAAGTSDYFMWERFMTKPLVDAGIFRKIGECPTPWPCFVIAVKNDFLAQNKAEIDNLLQIINQKTAHFKQIENIGTMLATRYNQQETDILEWLSLTEWSQEKLTPETLNNVQNQLLQLGLIEKKGNFAEIAIS